MLAQYIHKRLNRLDILRRRRGLINPTNNASDRGEAPQCERTQIKKGASTSCLALKICCNPRNSSLCYAGSTTSNHPETPKVEKNRYTNTVSRNGSFTWLGSGGNGAWLFSKLLAGFQWLRLRPQSLPSPLCLNSRRFDQPNRHSTSGW